MSQHKDKVRFQHMLDHAREAVAMIKGKERLDLDRDWMLELSLVRLVEIIGEAAARVRPESREKYPSIPWLKSLEYATGLFTDMMLSIWIYFGIRLSMIFLH